MADDYRGEILVELISLAHMVHGLDRKKAGEGERLMWSKNLEALWGGQ